MSKEQMYYSRTGHFPDEGNFDGVDMTKPRLEENFLRMAKCIDKAEIYVSTSQSYISASKRTIEDLKRCLINAEANMSTAEECTLELERRLKNLKSEIHILFNRSFCQNIDSPLNEISRTKSSVHTMSHDNSYLIEDLPCALEKYAEESNVNLKNHKASLQIHNGLVFVVLNQQNAEDKCSTSEINRAPSYLSVQDETLNSTLDNNLQVKEDDISFHVIDCQGDFSQAEDTMLNNDIGYKDSFSKTFVMQPSLRKNECKVSVTKEVIDQCNVGKFQSDCSGYYKSSAMNHLHKASGSGQIGQMSVVSASGSEKLQNDKCVQTESSGQNKKCMENRLNIVNKGNWSKSLNGCNDLYRSFTDHFKIVSPNQQNSEEILSSRAFQNDKLGYSSDQQDKYACKKKDAMMTMHANDAIECRWGISMNDNGAKRRQNKHRQLSENDKVQFEKHFKIIPESSPEKTSEMFLGRDEAADANHDANRGEKLIGILSFPQKGTESFYSTADNVSLFLKKFSPQGCRIPLPKSSSENNLSRILTGCTSKSSVIKTMTPCRKNDTDQNMSSEMREYLNSRNRTTSAKTPLHLQENSNMRNANTQDTEQRISSKKSKKKSYNRFAGNQINLSKKHLSSLKLFTPQFENQRLTTKKKEDFLERNVNPLFRTLSLKDLPSRTNFDFPEEPREINASDSIASRDCLISSVWKNVHLIPVSENRSNHDNQRFSTNFLSASPDSIVSSTEDLFFPVNKTNIIESSDSEGLHLMGDVSDDSFGRRMYGTYSREEDIPNEDNMESLATVRESRNILSFSDSSFNESLSGESDSKEKNLPRISISSFQTRKGTLPLTSSGNKNSFESKPDSYSSPTPDYSS